jgi:hypothetical protein
MICEDSWGAPEQGRFDASERLGQEATHLPAGLEHQPTKSQDDACQYGVQETAMSTLQPVVQAPCQGAVYDWLRGRHCGSAAWHSSLRP